MRLFICLCCLCWLTPRSAGAGEDLPITVISHGERVNLEDYLASGRWVLFDFYADWCGPCRKWSPILEKFARGYPNHVTMYKIDIRNWGTAVALQHEIELIPYVILYNKSGKRVAKGSPRDVLEKLQKRAKKEKWQ